MEMSSHNLKELTSALKRAREQIAQYEVEISEFQASSRELEKELELELEDGEKRQKELQVQVEKYRVESADWKGKYLELQKEASATQSSLLKEIGSLQSAHSEAVKQLHEIEMENDDMERHERITKSTLEEIEYKYHTALEEIAMLEADISGKDDLKTELQHVKEELRDTKEELQLTQANMAKLSLSSATASSATSASASVSGSVNSKSTAGVPRSLRSHQFLPPSQQQSLAATKQTTNSLPRLTSSRSLRKIHGMLDQMRNLETRVASFKSSLPIPKTPPNSNSKSMNNKSSPESPLLESNNRNIGKSIGRNTPTLYDGIKRKGESTTNVGHKVSYSSNSITSTPVVLHSHQLEPIEGSPNMSPLPTVSNSARDNHIGRENEHPKYSRKRSVSPKKSKESSRPGSAFSALHNRSGFGHGRLV